MTAHAFTKRWPINAIGRDGVAFQLSASVDECREIAARLRLPALLSLQANGRLQWRDGDTLTLDVDFHGHVVQDCVVSLDPFETKIDDHFSVVYVRNAAQIAALSVADEDPEQTGEEIFVDVMADDPPELLDSRGIDIGEMVIQHLSLALDPYPKAPAAIEADAAVLLEFVDSIEEDGGAAGEGPFAELAVLKSTSSRQGNGPDKP